MTTVIYFICAFLLFLLTVGFGQGKSLRRALIAGLSAGALPLAVVLLWLPYRIDLRSYRWAMQGTEKSEQSLTQFLFTCGCFFLAAIVVAFWLSTFERSASHGSDENESQSGQIRN